MKSIKLTLLLAALSPLVSMAQSDVGPYWCGHNHAEEQALKNHPDILMHREELKRFIDDYNSKKSSADDTTVYYIPTVFHIIHEYGTENISDDQVKSCIETMNKDFNAENNDVNQVVPEFANLVGNSKIRFRLATKDVMGNCTNGIEHIYSYKTSTPNDGAKLNPWQRDMYMNVWVVKRLDPGVAGYAYKPPSTNTDGEFSKADGIMVLHNYVGTIGTSNLFNSRTLTHEAGHWFNLDHPWGPTNNPGVACGDDGIEDTPVTEGFTTCNLNNGAICNPPIVENIQNYMDYSFCGRMFTKGQSKHMRTALNSSVSGRNNLWTQENLEKTGTATPYNPPLCTPLPDMTADRQIACVGDAIKFYDYSQRAEVESRVWTIPGADPETSTVKNPTFTFPTEGKYSVTLSTTNATGTETRTWTDYIEVRAGYSDFTVPFTEDFSDFERFRATWISPNLFNDDHKWSHSFSGGYGGGGGAVYFNNFGADQNNYDELISPAFDLQFATGAKLKFKYSVAALASDLTESLVVTATNNCGRTWVNVGTIDEEELFSASQWAESYVANNDAFWVEKEFNLNNANNFKKPNVRFRFTFKSAGRGNNAWIDDINLTSSNVGFDDLSTISGLNVYPNPNEGKLTLSFNNMLFGNYTLAIFNALGQEVYAQDLGLRGEGEQQVFIDAPLSNGLYNIVLASENGKSAHRFVVSK